MRKLSVKRSKQNREYLKLREDYLQKNPVCAFHADLYECQATTIHHKKGRCGALLTDVNYFVGVCMEAHEWIEKHPALAKERGYSLSRLSKEVSELKKV